MEHLQGTLTPLVHAHAERTQLHPADRRKRQLMQALDLLGIIIHERKKGISS